MTDRLTLVRKSMKKAGVEAFLVRKPENVYYLSGLEATEASIVLTKKTAFLIVDSRYYLKAKSSCDMKVELLKGSFYDFLNDVLEKKGIKNLAFEGKFLTFNQYKSIKKKTSAKLVEADNWVESARLVKNAKEITTISKAAKIADKAIAYAKHSVSLGMREIDLAKSIECYIRKSGARSESFEVIVASGPNSAKPHHSSGQRKIKAGDILLIDLGVKYQKYVSDITRTFLLEPVKPGLEQIYSVCLEAQKKSLAKIKSGKKTNEIDASARAIIDGQYPSKFGHNLGHGIGLEVHEAPLLGPKKSSTIQENMVFTVEPGIYLEGRGGVRIEDMVVAKKDGYRLLTQSPKEFKDIVIEL